MSEINYQIKVMTAFRDGCSIQVVPKFEDWREWKDCEKPSWDWSTYEYRVKPETFLSEEDEKKIKEFVHEDNLFYLIPITLSAHLKDFEGYYENSNNYDAQNRIFKKSWLDDILNK